MAGWRIRKREGVWLLEERTEKLGWIAFDSFDSLPDAHSYALACAVSNELFKRGGLSRFAALRDAAEWWAAYVKASEEWS